MIINQKYISYLSKSDIEGWITRMNNKRMKFLKFRLYVAKYHENGFYIREKRINSYQSFKPRIYGKFVFSTKGSFINIRIIPSITGMVFFFCFVIIFPLITLLSPYILINGIELSDYSIKIKNAGIILLISVPIMYFALIRPVYKAKTWIENELKLKRVE